MFKTFKRRRLTDSINSTVDSFIASCGKEVNQTGTSTSTSTINYTVLKTYLNGVEKLVRPLSKQERNLVLAKLLPFSYQLYYNYFLSGELQSSFSKLIMDQKSSQIESFFNYSLINKRCYEINRLHKFCCNFTHFFDISKSLNIISKLLDKITNSMKKEERNIDNLLPLLYEVYNEATKFNNNFVNLLAICNVILDFRLIFGLDFITDRQIFYLEVFGKHFPDILISDLRCPN